MILLCLDRAQTLQYTYIQRADNQRALGSTNGFDRTLWAPPFGDAHSRWFNLIDTWHQPSSQSLGSRWSSTGPSTHHSDLEGQARLDPHEGSLTTHLGAGACGLGRLIAVDPTQYISSELYTVLAHVERCSGVGAYWDDHDAIRYLARRH